MSAQSILNEFKDEVRNLVVKPTRRQRNVHAKLVELQAEEARLKKQIDSLKNEIKDQMIEGGIKSIIDGDQSFFDLSTPEGLAFDSAALKKDDPEVYELYKTKKQSPRLLIKK